MPEDELLKELSEYLEDRQHKEYIQAYLSSGLDGLSKKFDEIVEASTDET